MKTCSTSRRVSRAQTPDLLLAIATLMDTTYADDFHEDTAPRHMFSAVLDKDDIELRVKPIEGHPSDELLGFTAPHDWHCIGITTGAWASHCDAHEPTRMRGTDTERRRVRITHVVARSGEAISVLRDQHAGPVISRWADIDEPPIGLVNDLLRRSLGLPTAAAPASSIEWWALLWIDRLFQAGAEGHLNRAPWARIVELHPAYPTVRAAECPDLERYALERCDRLGTMVAQTHPWARLHNQAMLGELPVAELPVALAQWMDAGMFARHLLSMFPAIEDLLVDLHSLIEADAYCRLIDTIDAWGLLAE